MDPKAWGVLGTSTYAGGVSDSIYGATAYAYMDTNPEVNTGAKKAGISSITKWYVWELVYNPLPLIRFTPLSTSAS